MFRGLEADVHIGLSEEDQLNNHIADLRAFSATEVQRVCVLGNLFTLQPSFCVSAKGAWEEDGER